MPQNPQPGNRFEDNPLAQAILREGLEIQHRFSAKPVYRTTGRGSLKGAGIEEIAKAKKIDQRSRR